MRIIRERRLREFANVYPDAGTSLEAWRKIVKNARWTSFADVRATLATADVVGKLTVFNIGGNKYRLIAFIDYDRHIVFIRAVLTHSQYDRGGWKHDSWC
jgi:mRNA interferase HigB